MAKQTFTSGQVLTAAEMNSLQENDYNWTVTTKTASYTLAAGDEGTRIVMNNAGATTITVNDAVFSAGDVVWLHNIGAGTCTVTAGTATVSTLGELALEQYAGGHLYFTSASAAIFFPTAQSLPGKILQVVRATDTTVRSTTSTSFVDASISVTITPKSASSSVLLIWSFKQRVTNTGGTNTLGVYQITTSGNTALQGAQGVIYGEAGVGPQLYSTLTAIGWASPATTSATTYKGRFKVNNGPGEVQIDNTAAAQTGQLFALEISA